MTILLTKPKLGILKSAIKSRTPVMLIGETGVGKTTIVSQLAKEQGYTLIRLSLNDQVGREDLIGRYGLDNGSTKWVDGALTEAMREGKWIVLDELNSARPEVLFALHALLDEERAIVVQEKDNERVEAHENFRLFGTINPVSYHGTKNLNQAFLSRFVVVNVDVLPPAQETKLVQKKAEIELKDSAMLVSLAKTLRRAYKDGQIEYFASTRDLIMSALLIKHGVAYPVAVASAVFNKMSVDDIAYLKENVGMGALMTTAEAEGASLATELKEAEKLEAKLEKQREEVKRLEAIKESLEADIKKAHKAIAK